MPGDRIGHFELVEYVGGGGMGRVYRAVNTRLARTVALKVLPPDQATDPDAMQRFQNEAQSAARLDHDNVARTYYVGEDRGLHYIVFEFIEGVNIRLLVERKGPLPVAEAISYTIQVAEALAHADARQVVHRDIKPSNVLITPEGRVKLIDMGLARLRQTDASGADLTASGVTLGTFDYISPEQARDPRVADVRSDIYSLGCTLFFMLAERPPFPEGTVLQKLLQHQGDQPPDIRQFRPDVPDELKRVLGKMMAKSPRHRYASAAELVADLVGLAEEIGLRPMIAASRIWLKPPDEPQASLFHRILPWTASAAALLLIVLLLHVFWSRPVAPDGSLPPAANTRQENDVLAALTQKSPLPLVVAPTEEETKTARRDAASRPAEASGAFEANHATATSAPPKRSGLLVVRERAAKANEFSSLAAACAAARDGDVIELRFNGPREERPIKISNLRVTVRPAEGCQPVVVFRPDEVNPVKYPHSMLTLTAGRLNMSDVALELHVPREFPADNWSLLETCGGQTIRLERCSLTVRNASDQLTAYHQEVAFVRARPSPDAATAVESAPAATPLATLELADCVARGEAVFLRVEDLQPVYLLWDNGLLATTDRLLTVSGGQAAPKSDEMVRLDLRHLTAAVRGGLCLLSNSSANPYQLTVQFACTNDVILTAPGSPLIEQEGTGGVEKSRQRLVWNGDRNYYQNVDVFWLIRNLDAEAPPESMTFDAWKTYWGPSRENQPSREPLVWHRTPGGDRPLHAHTAADYTLEDPTFGDSPTGAPGVMVERLPPLPTEPFSEGPASSGSARSRTVQPHAFRG